MLRLKAWCECGRHWKSPKGGLQKCAYCVVKEMDARKKKEHEQWEAKRGSDRSAMVRGIIKRTEACLRRNERRLERVRRSGFTPRNELSTMQPAQFSNQL